MFTVPIQMRISRLKAMQRNLQFFRGCSPYADQQVRNSKRNRIEFLCIVIITRFPDSTEKLDFFLTAGDSLRKVFHSFGP